MSTSPSKIASDEKFTDFPEIVLVVDEVTVVVNVGLFVEQPTMSPDPLATQLHVHGVGPFIELGDKVPGFNVGNTRLQMVSELEEHIRENKTIIRSQRMISELRTFVYKNGRPDHMEGYHDDIIMAYAMCIFIIQTSFKKLEQVEKQTKAMLESWVNMSSAPQKPLLKEGYVNPFYTSDDYRISVSGNFKFDTA